MRLIGKLIKLTFLTVLCYGAIIVYEDFQHLLWPAIDRQEDIISNDYDITLINEPTGPHNESHTNPKQNSLKPDSDVKYSPSESEIKKRYSAAFEELYSQVNNKVTELMQAAYKEYMQKKERGEDISYLYFFTKYNRAAKNLEEATDEAFYSIYDSFVDELNTYGYDTEIANNYKSTYENKKSSIRTSIMKEAAKKF
ncbi:hypothetical protein CIB95_12080 [Lottiidibacillus patelloidae]|uniref:Uncharacterized protein n=1 Tax=Lottiidibacillus patelloidae TaxID=2670334 RepID=A0A263BS28_9BACI|nr:hypothetical protein [Lottiidibacillus patelloidae]OZM56504.1 hypothetical protein CIB95_12080 [Lottiidibacillus patelloidae]